jgi:hypothetical protein
MITCGQHRDTKTTDKCGTHKYHLGINIELMLMAGFDNCMHLLYLDALKYPQFTLIGKRRDKIWKKQPQ